VLDRCVFCLAETLGEMLGGTSWSFDAGLDKVSALVVVSRYSGTFPNVFLLASF